MANEVERDFYIVRFFYSLFGQCTSLVVSYDVCVGSYYTNDDIVVGGFNVFIIQVMKSL